MVMCGVVCGVVWCGVVWCGVVWWCGVWCGWCAVLCYPEVVYVHVDLDVNAFWQSLS